MNKELLAKLRHKASCNAGFEDGAEYTEIANALEDYERKLEIAIGALKVSTIMPRSHEAHRRAVQALSQIGGEE